MAANTGMGETPKFTLRLTSELREKLQLLADREKRTLGAYISIVLAEHAEEKLPADEKSEARRWLADAKAQMVSKRSIRAPRNAT